jgi:hypothetical protein
MRQAWSHWPVHTVSFDWFLSGLEWILSLDFLFTKAFDILPEIIMEYQIFHILSFWACI